MPEPDISKWADIAQWLIGAGAFVGGLLAALLGFKARKPPLRAVEEAEAAITKYDLLKLERAIDEGCKNMVVELRKDLEMIERANREAFGRMLELEAGKREHLQAELAALNLDVAVLKASRRRGGSAE